MNWFKKFRLFSLILFVLIFFSVAGIYSCTPKDKSKESTETTEHPADAEHPGDDEHPAADEEHPSGEEHPTDDAEADSTQVN